CLPTDLWRRGLRGQRRFDHGAGAVVAAADRGGPTERFGAPAHDAHAAAEGGAVAEPLAVVADAQAYAAVGDGDGAGERARLGVLDGVGQRLARDAPDGVRARGRQVRQGVVGDGTEVEREARLLAAFAELTAQLRDEIGPG